MLKLRISIVLLLAWLAGLYNIERIHEPINLASFVYVLAGILATTTICIPKLRKVTLAEITLAVFPIYALLKWYFNYPFGGANLPITITECVVLGVTNLLSWRVAHGIDEFVLSAGELAAMHLEHQPLTYEDGESAMYREVQRARRFGRTLSLAAISFSQNGKGLDLDRLVQKARNEILLRYLESRVTNALMASLSSSDLVVRRNGKLVLVMPEMECDVAREHLREATKGLFDELGVRVQVGVAEFPEEELTLAGLIDRAEAEMCWIGDTPVEAPEETAAQERAQATEKALRGSS